MALHLIVGPMFSGKTTRLIELYHSFQKKIQEVVAINYVDDRRYHDTMLSTHDLQMIPCIQLRTLANYIPEADIVLINEGQFFNDLFDTVLYWVERLGKTVYICGLDGDFKRKPFGDLLRFIPFCDSVVKLSANCLTCGDRAIFSHRITGGTEQLEIGADNYAPLCRKCYCAQNI